jgi:hypothetical protein
MLRLLSDSNFINMSAEKFSPPPFDASVKINKDLGMAVNLSEIIAKSLEIQFPPGFKEAYKEKVKDKNVMPLLLNSHQSHTDIISLMAETKILTAWTNEARNGGERFAGYDLLIASSLKEGLQGTFLKDGIGQVSDYLSQYSISTIEYMRTKDARLYNERLIANSGKGMSPEELEKFRDTTNCFGPLHTLARDIKKGKGIAMFPEATVQGGRLRTDGTIYGMQKLDCECVKFEKLAEIANNYDKKILFVFGATNGGYKIVSPDTQKPTPEAYWIIETGKMPPELMQTKTSMPIDWDEALHQIARNGKIDAGRIEDFVGTEIAKLLPPEARGYYRDLVAA